jgi:hypothetical protein
VSLYFCVPGQIDELIEDETGEQMGEEIEEDFGEELMGGDLQD